MNERQRAFADAYLATGNAAEAARQAGYSAECANRTGHRLLTNADVRAYIDERRQQIASEHIATAEEALEIVTEMLRDDEINPADRLRAANSLIRRFERVPNEHVRKMPIIIDDVGADCEQNDTPAS